jgi:hypothetical protein
MLEEIDLLIGLALEAKETENNPSAVINKARYLNGNVTAKMREGIIMPIMRARDPIATLNTKIDEFSARSRIMRGMH